MATAGGTVTLPAVLDLDTLDAVREQLLDAMDRGPASIDASAVERIATNSLLMLISAARAGRYSLRLLRPSAALLAAVERLGFTPYFAPMLRT